MNECAFREPFVGSRVTYLSVPDEVAYLKANLVNGAGVYCEVKTKCYEFCSALLHPSPPFIGKSSFFGYNIYRFCCVRVIVFDAFRITEEGFSQ